MTIDELTLPQAWELLTSNPRSLLVDVRTKAEWAYVGVPDLSTISKEVRFVEWVDYPDRTRNPAFVTEATAGVEPDQPILLLCRSGVRSAAAATELLAAGFTAPFNVTAGFEGDLSDDGHREGGWKHSGLPWRQS